MIREVVLQKHLPPFMTEYKEIDECLEAENPEFRLAWNAADRTLKNEFIENADEYGISRFEKLLNILPYQEDTLEARRARVFIKWFNMIPYTWRVFLNRLQLICGENNFTIEGDFDHYLIKLDVNLEAFGLMETLEALLITMVPCNMVLDVFNKIPADINGQALIYIGFCAVETIFDTNDWKEDKNIPMELMIGNAAIPIEKQFTTNDDVYNHDTVNPANVAGGTVSVENFFFTNDENGNQVLIIDVNHAGGMLPAEKTIISNDSNETVDISNTANLGNGAVSAEFIEIN